MGRLRIVLYAEGPRETAGFTVSRARDKVDLGHRAAGEAIPDEELGPGHVLVRRILVEERGLPEGAIQFEEGLRDRRGRVALGSKLLGKSTLRQLLRWADPARTPHLAVVLVDRDGVDGRRETLRAFLDDLHNVPWIVAVAREEFEAWLIADESAATALLGCSIAQSPEPETLAPRDAKDTFALWLASAMESRDPASIRRDIAERCGLEILKRRCTAFEQFVADLLAVTF